MSISVVINTYNAEQHLSRVLESVKAFDEIVVCDMYSTDNTIAIAKQYGCKIIYHEHTGYVEPARQYAVEAASHEWVFIVDADEVVPAKLRAYLYEQIKKDNCPSGLRIPRKNYFMGRFMHCTYPDYIVRFFRKEGTICPREIHRQPIVNGRTENVSSPNGELAFIHLANDSVRTILAKMNTYTDFEIEKRLHKNYTVLSLVGETAFRFIKLYFIKGAWKDGMAGLLYAGLFAFYKYATIAKIKEHKTHYPDLQQDLDKSAL